MKLELPYPPGVNTLYGVRAVIKREELVKLLLEVKRGLDVHEAATRAQRLAAAFPYKTKEHTDYATHARLAMYEAGLRAEQLPRWPRPSLLRLELRLYRPRNAGDIDGPLKTLFDSLQGNVYENDDQVDKLVIDRFTDRARPRVELEFTLLAAELQPDDARQEGLDLGFTPPAASMSAPRRNYARAVSNLPDRLDQRLRRLAKPAVVSNRSDDPEAA